MFEAETQQLDNVEEETPDSVRSRAALTVLIGCTALLGGVLFGYDLGIISSALLQLSTPMRLTCVMKELVVSALLLGALLGSLAGGFLLDLLGRRSVLIINSLLFLIGALILSVAQSYYVVFLGRLVVGVSVSVAAMGECLYTSEVASPQHRGKMVSLNEMGITLGILSAYLVGYLFIEDEQGWRFMFGLSAVPAVVQFFCLLVLPPSPRFLMMRGREEAAAGVLRRLRHGDVRPEMDDIRTLLQNEKNRTCLDLCSRTGNFHYRLFIGASLSIFQQLSGHGNVIYYAPVLLQGLGLMSHQVSTLTTVGLGVVKVLSTGVALLVVDRVGRRTLLFAGSGLMALGLMIIAVAAAELPELAHRGTFCVDRWENSSGEAETAAGGNVSLHDAMLQYSTASIVSVFALMVYVAAYAFGFGPVTWLLLSEIYPPTLRGRAIAWATSLNWLSNLGVSLTFLSALENMGAPITFGGYCAVCALVVGFIIVFVPETKGKSLERISREFDSGTNLPSFLRTCEPRVPVVGEPDPVTITYSHLSDI